MTVSAAYTAIVASLQKAGVPDSVTQYILGLEGTHGQNPVTPDTGGYMSVGPLQLYTGPQGQAAGLDPTALQRDVAKQVSIGVPPIVEAFQVGNILGLTGSDLNNFVAEHSGHPEQEPLPPVSTDSGNTTTPTTTTGTVPTAQDSSGSTETNAASATVSSGILVDIAKLEDPPFSLLHPDHIGVWVLGIILGLILIIFGFVVLTRGNNTVVVQENDKDSGQETEE